MHDLTTTLLLQTAMVLAAAVAGVLLHLKLHPLRQHLSDARDILIGMPWLTVLGAILMLLAEAGGERWVSPAWPLNELWSWREIAGPLALGALAEQARMFHGLLPVWPLGLVLPMILTTLTWRFFRFPGRYGPRRQRPAERWLLLACTLISWTWLVLELLHVLSGLVEWLEPLRVALRSSSLAVMMAFSQIMLLQFILARETPKRSKGQQDFGLALEHTFARWRSLGVLAVLDLLLLTLLPANAAPEGAARWLLVWAAFLFAAVPLAVASNPGSLRAQGASAMHLILGAALPLIGMTITTVVTLSLVRYASALIMGLTEQGHWLALVLLPVHALVLATVRNWVFLAIVLTLLRHGFKSSSSGRAA
jgi:hypothetical protein